MKLKQTTLLLGFALVALLTGCATLPDDGKDAKMTRFDNLQDVRYTEIWLIGGNGITKNLDAVFYNTTGLNKNANPKDSTPMALLDKIEPDRLKKQYDVLGVFKNGPRSWCYDWIELPVGTERDFNGLKARWFGVVKLPKQAELKKKGSTAYKPTTVQRKSHQGYAKGQTVFILDDPNGTPWVMQAYSMIVDPNLNWAGLSALDQKLKLPPGWKYRTKVLDQDLHIGAVNGTARVVQDDLENTYNACFEEGGQKNYNFKP
jgi:hypothetical protein